MDLTGLISFWELEEASGTRADAHGTNHLTDNNTVTQAAGKVGNAALFAVVNNEYLEVADTPTLDVGDADFTVVAWVYFNSIDSGTYPIILSKNSFNVSLPNQAGYLLYYYEGDSRFHFGLSSTGINADRVEVLANTFGAASTATWYFVVGQYDATANLIYISINNGAQDSTAQTGGAFSNTSSFKLGQYDDSTDANAFFDGRIDQVCFWKRKLNSTELTFLYNSGGGRSYAEIVPRLRPQIWM